MLRRYGVYLSRQGRSSQHVNFIGVNLGAQAMLLTCPQHPAGLGNVKHAGFTEYVAEFCQSCLRHGGDNLGLNQAHIVVRTAQVFFRHGMRSHQRGNQFHALPRLQRPNDLKLLELICQAQAIAALGLAGCHAHGEHFFQQSCRLFHQRLL